MTSSRVVSFARDRGLELAVRSGGHSRAGYGTTDGGIVIDLSGMKAVEIDADAKTAWVETGITRASTPTAPASTDWSPASRQRLGRNWRHHARQAASASSSARTG